MAPSNKQPLIQMKNINLYFGHFQALKDVSVDFDSGELVGLVGDNGAGKTTLIRILCGIHEPTTGEVLFDGKKVDQFHPKLAIELGIETIQQAVGLCDNLSIARNFYLGREPVKKRFGIPLLDFDVMRDKSARSSAPSVCATMSVRMMRSRCSRAANASRSRSAARWSSRTA